MTNQTKPDSAAPGGDVEQRARELLAREYDSSGCTGLADAVRKGEFTTHLDTDAIRAIIAALSAPKQVGVVPDGWNIGRLGGETFVKSPDGSGGWFKRAGNIWQRTLFDLAGDMLASPQAAPVPVEGDALSPPDGDSFAGWAAWLRDRIATILDPYVQRPHAEKLAAWLESLEDAPPPEQPAVELEQFSKAIGDELLSLSSAMNDARKAKLVYGSLDRIMALIDGAKAGRVAKGEG